MTRGPPSLETLARPRVMDEPLLSASSGSRGVGEGGVESLTVFYNFVASFHSTVKEDKKIL